MSVATILLLEDDPVFGEVLKRALQRRGYTALLANSVDACLAMAAEQALDYAILDLKLADEVSLPVIPQLLTLHQDLRILILTGYASIATAVHAIKLGAHDYLPKPAAVDDILHALLTDNPQKPPTTLQPLSVKRLEWEHIQKALQENHGNISATARQLNMHRRTLQRKLQKRLFRA